MATKFNELVIFSGGFSCPSGTYSFPASAISNSNIAADAAIARSKLAQRQTAIHVLRPQTFTHHDAPGTPVNSFFDTDPSSLAGEPHMGVYVGATGIGTDMPVLATPDFGGVGGTFYARRQVEVPPTYEAGETLQIKCSAAMVTAVADTSCTLDLVAYLGDGEGGVGSDICQTDPMTINSAVWSTKTFTLQGDAVAAGGTIDIRFAVTAVDGGDAGLMRACLDSIALLADLR